MKTRALRSLPLTELGLGGGPLGNHTRAISDQQAVETIDAAWAGGVRYFDTAPHYGLGLSERRFGQALRERPRDEFVLSTKVGRLLEPNPHPTGSDLAAADFDVPDDLVRRFDYSRDGVHRSLEASLDRLGLDRVDIVYVHDADDHVDDAIEQAIPALIELRDQGVIGAVGVGMNQWQAPLRMVRETDLDVVMLAGRWTLLDRSGQPLLDECAARGVQIVAAAPFNSGLLARDRPERRSPRTTTCRRRRTCSPGRPRSPTSANNSACRCRPRRCSSRCAPATVAAVVAGLQSVERGRSPRWPMSPRRCRPRRGPASTPWRRAKP